MRTKQKAPTPTFRAGLNFHDPTRSGFARVGILGQEDLFPNEGMDFPIVPVDKAKQTKSYLVSRDSPFHGNVSLPIVPPDEEKKVIEENLAEACRTELMCTRAAAKAIGAVTPGELRPLHSQIAAEAINKDRQAQMRMRDELRVARMREEEHWQEVEHEEALATKKIEQSIFGTKRSGQGALAASYREQFRLHDARLAAEKAEDAREAAKIRELEAEEAAKEQERQKRLKQIAEERRKEFQTKNTELLQRRQKRIEQDLEQERIIEQQHAEQEALMEQREAAVRKRREQLNQVRERIVNEQTKRLIQIQERDKRLEKETESGVSKREEERRIAEERRKVEMEKQRNAEYRAHLRYKDEMAMNQPAEELPPESNEDEARRVEADIQRSRQKTQQKYLLAQIQARKRAELQAKQEELNAPATMYFLKDDEEWN